MASAAVQDQAIPGMIFVGGKSTRMGTPKARLNVGCRTCIEHVIRRMRPVVSSITLIGTAPGLDFLDLPQIPDRRPGHGPLCGLETALELAETSAHILVVACDLPCVPSGILRLLAKSVGASDAAVPLAGGIQHPLCAVYSRTCLPVVQDRLERGQYGMLGLLAAIDCIDVTHDESGIPLNPNWFINVNTPEDLQRARDCIED
jgi:molybdopterin-guanine dinucleotide biosynthesis protein A